MDTPPPSEPSPPASSSVLLPAISRLGVPVFLFGVAFLIATSVLTSLVTPDRFPVRIGDTVVRLIDLEAEQKKLLQEKSALEMTSGLFEESRTPVLHQLGLLRSHIVPVGRLLLQIEESRVSFRSGDHDPIVLASLQISGSGSRILLGGEVRTPGDSSMQTLASFVDILRSLPHVASVREPEYTKHQETDGTTVSPFSITLLLDHD